MEEGEIHHQQQRFPRFLRAHPSIRMSFMMKKINWAGVMKYCMNWSKHPMNMALIIWTFFVAIGLVILFLLMTGILDGAIPNSSVRKTWTEIANQIVNALFTIMCVYQHPRLVHQLVLLWRWTEKDASEMRKLYCRYTSPHPHERARLTFVVVLFHITCFAQYGYCALFWAYNSRTRPDWPQYICIAVGTISPLVAGVYVVMSPLGRKDEVQENNNDEEAQEEVEIALSTMSMGEDGSMEKVEYRKVVVMEPEWRGGLFHCWEDKAVLFHSFFCTFFVFGWNMERLGFGNIHVHVITFILFIVTPVVVFYVSSLHISDDAVKLLVIITGVVLSILGLMYGGYWRMQMRRRFKLPTRRLPVGCSPGIADFMEWLFCWPCALAQEVRTGNFYEVEDNSFYRKEKVEEGEGEGRAVIDPLPRENGTMMKTCNSSQVMDESGLPGAGETSTVSSMEMGAASSGEGMHVVLKTDAMTPPFPPLMQMRNEDEPGKFL